MPFASDHPLLTGATSGSLLVQAYSGNRAETLPIWMMRQAGRSLPEYRAARANTAMLESCLMPELAAEITLQPVRRHSVDAAIFFSDIVVPLKLAGVDVTIEPGVGPVMATPVRTRHALEALQELSLEQLEPIIKAVQLVVAELGTTPLIGFGGAIYPGLLPHRGRTIQDTPRLPAVDGQRPGAFSRHSCLLRPHHLHFHSRAGRGWCQRSAAL